MLNYSANSKTGYFLTRSLRFRASASAYLSRTTGTATNANKWTWSGWVKRGTLGGSSVQVLMNGYVDDSNLGNIGFNGDSLYMARLVGGSVLTLRVTNAVFRDPSAWYHIVFVFDNANATVADRVQIYVNSVLQTYSTSNDPSTTGMYINANSTAQRIGRSGSTTSQFYFDGYIAEQNFIDGQALTPSSFGSTNSTTGVWQPARYVGTYGTNGFYLPYTDNSALTTSSNVGLGKDFSGNGNYWVTNNISLTSGVTYDSMTDVPTLTSATAANYAVLNPLDNATPTLTNANLTPTSSGSWGSRRSTIAMAGGKWYCEVTSGGSTTNIMLGIISDSSFSGSTYIGAQAQGYAYFSDGTKYNNLSNVAYGASYTSGDVIGIAFDADARTLTFYKNNVSQGVAYSSIPAGTFYFATSVNTTGFVNINFGQRPFAYTPPSGFVALNVYNLPDSTIKQGNKVMDATLYTGNGAARSITNTAGFKPDLVWVKSRSAATDHKLTDSVRGATKGLISNLNAAETTDANGLTAFNSNGWSLGTDTVYNNNTSTYVGWQWQAGQGSTSSNTSGTITSTVSVNAAAGFSVMTFTTTGINCTVGHGLGVAPSMVVIKARGQAGSWGVYHSALPTPTTGLLILDSTAAVSNSATYWNSTSPSSTVFSLGTAWASTSTVAYCWSEIAGYSKFGSYIGNGSADGPFVYLGFIPKFVMIKSSSAVTSWVIEDSSRDVYNPETNGLFAENIAAEVSGYLVDFLSNGFKVRNTTGNNNSSGNTYIYAAFASNTFKNSLAR